MRGFEFGKGSGDWPVSEESDGIREEPPGFSTEDVPEALQEMPGYAPPPNVYTPDFIPADEQELYPDTMLPPALGDNDSTLRQTPGAPPLADRGSSDDLPDDDTGVSEPSGLPERHERQDGEGLADGTEPEADQDPLDPYGVSSGNAAEMAAISARLKELDERPGTIKPEPGDATENQTRDLLLERQALLVREEYDRLKKGMVETVDWDGLLRQVSKLVEGDGSYGTSAFFGLLCQDSTELQQVAEGLPILQEWASYCVENNLLVDKSVPAPDDSVVERQQQWLPDGNLVDASYDWECLTKEALEYLSPERQTAADKLLLDISDQLYELRPVIAVLDQADAANTPEQIAGAMKRSIATVFEGFDRADRTFMDQNLQKGPLYIKNEALAVEKLGIANPQEWVEEKMYNYPFGFPPEYLRGLISVRFTDEYKDIRVKDEEEKTRKFLGHYDYEDREVAIGVVPLFAKQRQEYYKAHMNPEKAKEEMRKTSADIVNLVWDHEATHYAHRHTLPVSWLREWHKITTEERVRVTDYVALTYKEDAYAGGREDLADSVMLYKSSPGSLLAAKAYGRFRKINEVLQLYDSRTAERLIKRMQNETLGKLHTQRVADNALLG